MGDQALYKNTASSNTAIGVQALYNNTDGGFNTANGEWALRYNTTGGANVASGNDALYENTTGSGNIAYGVYALQNNTTGNFNIALGNGAGLNLTTGDNNIDIANNGVAGESGKIRIGTQGTQTATYIAGISGAAVAGDTVVVNSLGQLGIASSSRRFKDEIKPMGKASEALLALNPVTFRYKKEFDPNGRPQFGLVAEQVSQGQPRLGVT